MTARIAATAIVCLAGWLGSPQHTEQSIARTGIAKYYRPGLMAQVARNRGMRMLPWVDGYAATTDCGRIGQVVQASINGGPLEFYQILDCSHPRDRARHLRERLVLEVDYQSAVRNGFARAGRAPATVVLPRSEVAR